MCRVLLSTNKVALLPTIAQSTATPTAAASSPNALTTVEVTSVASPSSLWAPSSLLCHG